MPRLQAIILYMAVENKPYYSLIANVNNNEYTHIGEANKRVTYKVCCVSGKGNERRESPIYVNPRAKKNQWTKADITGFF